MIVVEVILRLSFKVTEPKALFDIPDFTFTSDIARSRDVSEDGQRFLVNATEQHDASPLTVITNWQAKLKK